MTKAPTDYETAQKALMPLICLCESMNDVSIGDFKTIVSRVVALMQQARKEGAHG